MEGWGDVMHPFLFVLPVLLRSLAFVKASKRPLPPLTTHAGWLCCCTRRCPARSKGESRRWWSSPATWGLCSAAQPWHASEQVGNERGHDRNRFGGVEPVLSWHSRAFAIVCQDRDCRERLNGSGLLDRGKEAMAATCVC